MLDGFKDVGSTMAIGKVEQGTVRPGMKCIVMPEGKKCTVVTVRMKCDPKAENDEEMQFASCGENVTLKVHGITEDELKKGYVLCAAVNPIPVVSYFKAQMQILELPEERPVLTAGYKCVIHLHVAAEECEINKLIESIDPKKKPPVKTQKPQFVREGMVVTCSIVLARPTSLDTFANTQQVGRFTLRDETKTIAIGKVLGLPKPGVEEKRKEEKKLEAKN